LLNLVKKYSKGKYFLFYNNQTDEIEIISKWIRGKILPFIFDISLVYCIINQRGVFYVGTNSWIF
jgi:hypothetical protein